MTEQTTQRLAALRKRMSETGTGLVAIAPGSHMDWVLGFHPHPDERPCLLLIAPEKEAFLMPALNAEGTRAFVSLTVLPRVNSVPSRSSAISRTRGRAVMSAPGRAAARGCCCGLRRPSPCGRGRRSP